MNRMSRKPRKEVRIVDCFHLFGDSLEDFLKDITSQAELLVLSNAKGNWLIWGCLVMTNGMMFNKNGCLNRAQVWMTSIFNQRNCVLFLAVFLEAP